MTGHWEREAKGLISPEEVREVLKADLARIAAALALLEQIPIVIRDLEARLGRKSLLLSLLQGGSRRRLVRVHRRGAMELAEIARDLHGTIDALDEAKDAVKDAEWRVGASVSVLETHLDTILRMKAEIAEIGSVFPWVEGIPEADLQRRLDAIRGTVLAFTNVQRGEASPALLLIGAMRQQVGCLIGECRAFGLGLSSMLGKGGGARAADSPGLEAELRSIVGAFAMRTKDMVVEFRGTLERYLSLIEGTSLAA